MCNSCQIKIGQAADVQAGVAGISLNGVMNESFSSLLAWAWCINEEKVKAAFKSAAAMDIDDSDLPVLIKANIQGTDVKIHKVNFKDLVKRIRFTQAERDNASCKVMLTR